LKALVKTLFGDAGNIAAVAVVVAVGAAMTGIGHAGWAVFAMPAVCLAAVAWLAGR
jgi:type IV secretory pathway VirB2 component (pilin)